MKTECISVLTGTVLLLFPSCEDGLLKGIYDKSEEQSEYGFLQTETQNSHGTVYINSSAYTEWVYIDFAGATAVTLGTEGQTPESWDMAVHRYDTKTNEGRAAITGYTDIDECAESGDIPEDDAFVKDIWTDDVIATDMSGMMDGNIVYAEDWYNPELSRWLDVDTSTMPPVYTKSDNVFILKTADGRTIALKLENYMNASAVKGYMTIQYRSMQ